MLKRPAIMPAVPFASRADRERASRVMRPIMTECVFARQIDAGDGVSGRAYPCGMTGLRFADDRDASRYTLHRGDDLVSVLDYRDDGRSVSMTRAYTVPTFRGHGYAGELVDRAVAALERAGERTVVPMCWYVAEWFEAHPERAGILRGGVS